MTRQYVDKWLKKAVADLDIDVRAGTHMMRKTFAYHHIVEAKDRARALEQLMLLLGHTSLDVTLDYAGITEDELKDCYEEVQLAATIYLFSLLASFALCGACCRSPPYAPL